MSGSNAGAFPQVGLSSIPNSSSTRSSAPNPTRRQNLFATAIIEEDARDRGKRATKAGLAFALQAAIVGVLLLVPLLFTEGLDLYKVSATMLVAPPPPAPPPPPAVRVQAVVPKQALLHPQLTTPTVIPRKISVSAPDAGAAAPMIADSDGGVPGGVAGGVLGGIGAGPAPPPPPAPSAKPHEPGRIFSGMKEPALIYAPPLVYSPIARQAHIAGTVVIEAVIDEKGNVTQVHVVSGPPLLLDSALKAVAGRRYQPTILDGQPVSIRFDVKVEFRLS